MGTGAGTTPRPAPARPALKGSTAAQARAFIQAVVAAGIAAALGAGLDPAWTLIVGLAVFGAAFAVNSAVHSYLILAYTDGDKVALNVGFYYMANAGGRLAGTILSGTVFQFAGLEGCLWACAAFLLAAGAISWWLPRHDQPKLLAAGAVAGEE